MKIPSSMRLNMSTVEKRPIQMCLEKRAFVIMGQSKIDAALGLSRSNACSLLPQFDDR